MENVKPKVLVKDVQSQTILFECEVSEAEKAYNYAAEMDEMGLDVMVVCPTLGDTLSHSLGVSKRETDAYKESLEEEMEAHDDGNGSCCFKKE